MKILRLSIAAAIVAMSGGALAQGGDADGGVNARGTIGPTVTAKPPAAHDTSRRARDQDVGRYGVRGGVGDPSVGAELTRGFKTAPSSLNRPETGFRVRRLKR